MRKEAVPNCIICSTGIVVMSNIVVVSNMEVKKTKYNPEWALHAAEDLAERLFLLDVFDSEPTDSAREEYASLLSLAEHIAYSLVKPEPNEKEEVGRRKVLFTNGMNPDKMLIITDAPRGKIEEFCRHLNQEMENDENTYFDFLKKDYYVNVLFDSEFTSEREDIEVIGYDECYDFSDFPVDGRVRFNSEQEMLCYLQNAHDLYNPETGEYVWLYNEAGSIAVDKLSKEDILRILNEREPGESWSGYIPGGADIWDDVSYDGCKVPDGCTNLDYCKGHFAEYWVECEVYGQYIKAEKERMRR